MIGQEPHHLGRHDQPALHIGDPRAAGDIPVERERAQRGGALGKDGVVVSEERDSGAARAGERAVQIETELAFDQLDSGAVALEPLGDQAGQLVEPLAIVTGGVNRHPALEIVQSECQIVGGAPPEVVGELRRGTVQNAVGNHRRESFNIDRFCQG